MLETIREFAIECLEASGEAGTVRERHARHFLELAERAEPHLLARDRVEWLRRLGRELPNIRAALAWFVESGAAESAARLAAAFWRYWQMKLLLEEGSDRIADVLAMHHVGEHPRAYARLLGAAGSMAYWMGDADRSRARYAEALALAEELADEALVAEAHYNLAWSYIVPGAFDEGRAHARQALEGSERLADAVGIARATWALGCASQYSGDLTAAGEELRHAVRLFRPLDDVFGLGWALHNLGQVQLAEHDLAGARSSLEEALRIFVEADDLSGIALLVDRIGELAAAEGDLDLGLRLSGAAAAMQRRTGAGIGEAVRRLTASASDVQVVPEDLASAAWVAGHQMSLAEAVAHSLRGPSGGG